MHGSRIPYYQWAKFGPLGLPGFLRSVYLLSLKLTLTEKAPENKPSQKESSLPTTIFQSDLLLLFGCPRKLVKGL